MHITDVMIMIGFIFFAIILAVFIIIGCYLYFVDCSQRQHPILRNYPLVGRARYFFETLFPELRQYLFNNDNEGEPFSRNEYQHIVKKAKYKRDVIGFGSVRNFEDKDFYFRNSMFPKLTEELKCLSTLRPGATNQLTGVAN